IMPLAGALADRLDKRKMVVLTQFGMLAPAGLAGRALWLELPPVPLPYKVGPRIGISRNKEAPLRFWLPGDPTVSGRRS
ncbi:hypothetical protein R6H00_10110, partial [Actinotignum timonense]|nr:hypothetical protein [Actinotignum timonense]